MVWVFAVLAIVAGLGIVVHTNRSRFERRVTDEMRALLAVPHSALAPPRSELAADPQCSRVSGYHPKRNRAIRRVKNPITI
jgi:hypothetical protein